MCSYKKKRINVSLSGFRYYDKKLEWKKYMNIHSILLLNIATKTIRINFIFPPDMITNCIWLVVGVVVVHFQK
jgi:hypothetical protein